MSDDVQPHMMPGKFSWNELCTRDIEAAKAFYGTVFGWTFAPAEAPNDFYTIISKGEDMVGGLMALPPESQLKMPPAWCSYVTVEDVDAVVAAVKANGGTVLLEPMDIPNVGRMAFFADPQGAAIGICAYLD